MLSLLFTSLCILLPQDEKSLLEAFAKLPADKQTVLVKEIETAIHSLETALDHTVIEICQRDDAPKDPIEVWKGRPWHDPKIFAPALPIARKVLPDNDPKWADAKSRFLKTQQHYDLEGTFYYSIGNNKIYRLAAQTPPKTKIENYLKGYPPDADRAYQILLSLLDDDGKMDETAKYFDHAYSDRDGNVFPSIRIYDVWNSGLEIEMPDIDAIPFARTILKDNSYKSPIPAGPAREKLYQTIGEHFQNFRRYREMREAAAAYFLGFSPPVSAFIEPMRDRFHLLIVNVKEDPFMVRQFIKSHPKREDFIAEMDVQMREMKNKAYYAIQSRKTQLEADQKTIRELTVRLLKEKLGM